MRGIGVLEDGFVFTEAELERGTPRFWWGLRKRAAYDRALARRGMGRRDERDDDDETGRTFLFRIEFVDIFLALDLDLGRVGGEPRDLERYA